MNYPHDQLATEDDACREFARNVGRDNAEQEWILTGFDTWVRNPFYTGPKGRHPEDDYYEEYDFEGEAGVEASDDMPF
jgi:hypothetical protein